MTARIALLIFAISAGMQGPSSAADHPAQDAYLERWSADARVEWPISTLDLAKIAGEDSLVIQCGLLRNAGWGADNSLIIIRKNAGTKVGLQFFRSIVTTPRTVVSMPVRKALYDQTDPIVTAIENLHKLTLLKPALTESDAEVGGLSPGESAISLVELVEGGKLFQVRLSEASANKGRSDDWRKVCESAEVLLSWVHVYAAENAGPDLELDLHAAPRLPVLRDAPNAAKPAPSAR